MHPLPHHYSVDANAAPAGTVDLSSSGLVTITSEPPAEFGGSGTLWSPETLLVAAVADCFILTFRAVARASKLEWLSLECVVIGTLDRDSVTRFTDFHLRVVVVVPEGTDESKATHLLEKSEHGCLITSSLNSNTRLDTTVRIAASG